MAAGLAAGFFPEVLAGRFDLAFGIAFGMAFNLPESSSSARVLAGLFQPRKQAAEAEKMADL
ncbi:MAG: hypothetical protein J0H78_10295 [Rhizobiales bacterium]|nr:hypothetical protein [Hyphomicrobiales bacterium]OJY46527.1 MAG: hypothetical protein BGP08_15905 [Rhizobiales bacterium 64-17]